MRSVLALLLVVHGATHLLGAAKGFGIAELAALKLPIGPTGGVCWLLAALGFLTSAVMLQATPSRWWMLALPTLLLSQGLIVLAWSDAKFGTLANVIVAVPLAFAILEAAPRSFGSLYALASARHLAQLPTSAALVSEAELEALPPLLQTYLRRARVLGKPRVLGFRARFHGRFRQGLDGRWMAFTSEQRNFIAPSARLFVMRASLFGVPVDAYHEFVGAEARFRVRVFSLVDVVDGRGPAMNQSETVTIFNELCMLAPAALVEVPARWTTIDAHSVRGRFDRGDQAVAAVLTFDEQGDLINFVSEDRFYSADGKSFSRLPWSTPLRDHRDFAGVRIPARGDAVWKTPAGDFVYGEFHLDELEYFSAAQGLRASPGG
ncbi:MAG: hypothetical protein IPL40_14795 [Proteobacteria bacterium]|nr:hypothetical protein [Pseudomonadota bacterium]